MKPKRWNNEEWDSEEERRRKQEGYDNEIEIDKLIWHGDDKMKKLTGSVTLLPRHIRRGVKANLMYVWPGN